ncbi:unnamed protein product [Arctia plantaginis]|uniref:Uncharacterized protein n=1 Tax=Arctia plantaginis TaxID=874455 RepID=A0A8S0ZBN0_ARCPL|nr:unnamed protein product [Arctia plantaginis]
MIKLVSTFKAQLFCAIVLTCSAKGRNRSEDFSPLGDFIDQMIKPYILFANQIINQSYTQPSMVINKGDKKLLNEVEGDVEALVRKMTGRLKSKMNY